MYARLMAEPDELWAFTQLRKRAFQLADTGNYADWRAVGAALELEDFPDAINRISAAPTLKRLLTARCARAMDQMS
jgi:hypothetical protein